MGRLLMVRAFGADGSPVRFYGHLGDPRYRRGTVDLPAEGGLVDAELLDALAAEAAESKVVIVVDEAVSPAGVEADLVAPVRVWAVPQTEGGEHASDGACSWAAAGLEITRAGLVVERTDVEVLAATLAGFGLRTVVGRADATYPGTVGVEPAGAFGWARPRRLPRPADKHAPVAMLVDYTAVPGQEGASDA